MLTDLKAEVAPALPEALPARRSNAARRAETQARLIATTIVCLHEVGYGATTTLLVAKRARVTRGGLLHHFPSKVDLMLAVAEHLGRWQYDKNKRELIKLPPGAPRLLAVMEVAWRVALEPPAIALLEIMIGARSDPELAERLSPILESSTRRHRDAVQRIARDAGIDNPALIDAMTEVALMIVQGLEVRMQSSQGTFDPTMAVELVKAYWRSTLLPLIATAKSRVKVPGEA